MNTIFVDVDTQLDFLAPGGALYTPGAEKITAALGQLTRCALANRIPLLSTADAHSEDDPEFRSWPPHCVVHTAGQQKLAATLTAAPLVLPSFPTSLDEAALRQAPQILIEKQQVDCFTNRNLQPLLALFEATRFIVYGVVTEVCVMHAAQGLLNLGHSVEIVTDAIGPLDPQAAARVLSTLYKQGAAATTAAAVCEAVVANGR